MSALSKRRNRAWAKTYLIPIIFSIAFVLLSPLGLFAIFLSGDSCCGENTSGTMIAVTVGIVILLSVIALVLNIAVKLTLKSPRPASPFWRRPWSRLARRR